MPISFLCPRSDCGDAGGGDRNLTGASAFAAAPQCAFAACFSVLCASVSNCRQKYTEDLILFLLRYFAHLHQIIDKKVFFFVACLFRALRSIRQACAAMFSLPCLPAAGRRQVRAYAAPGALCSPCLRQVRAYARFFFYRSSAMHRSHCAFNADIAFRRQDYLRAAKLRSLKMRIFGERGDAEKKARK